MKRLGKILNLFQGIVTVQSNAPRVRSRPLTVYYDGGCPLCRWEIAAYRSSKGADAIEWVDLCEVEDSNVAPGLTREDAMARFHAIDSLGNIYQGGAAFAAIWFMLPRLHFLGSICFRWPF